MVVLSTVTESNERFAKERHENRVCVFAGATSGIGLATLKRMAILLQSSTFYILGRSPSRYELLLNDLRKTAPSSQFVFLETQVSLISSIDNACRQIVSSESKVDYLCMSPGGIPFQGAEYTKEGLETCFAISYYSRLRLVLNLMPLLQQASQPHVLSILNGTKEKLINEHDLNLDNHWGIIAVVNHTTLMTSLSFDHLSANDNRQHITFLHSTPGLVNTNTTKHSSPARDQGILWCAFVAFLQILSGWVTRFVSLDVEESGERMAYQLTSDKFTPGSWRIDKDCNILPNNQALSGYKNSGWMEKVWEFTQQMWDKALIMGDSCEEGES